jgi:gamma-glutamyl-gamma-aminobutyrate hydrolase PuuD
VACGWADDGTIEAVALPDRTWAFGVQWHPEAHAGEQLFAAFVTACAQYWTGGQA